MARAFDLGDVLSVTTGLLVSPRRVDGVYDILNFMTGDNLFTHQLPGACGECAPHLVRQHPWLDSPEVKAETAALEELLKTPAGGADPDLAVIQWLDRLKLRFGATADVEPLPPGVHEKTDPLRSLEAMFPGKEIIMVETGGPDA